MKFLRLTTMIINPSAIRTIVMSDTNYTIYLMTGCKYGYTQSRLGKMDSFKSQIVIDKEKNLSDYRMLQYWINNSILTHDKNKR